MKKRPNILWIMTDQHNANCAGFAGHPQVKTPNLDKIAKSGVQFTNAFCQNPICSPSRICFSNGQYVHSHRLYGNFNSNIAESNPDTLAALFRRNGYQAALIGKSHMVRKWDEEGYEHIRYTDLVDAWPDDPCSCHYFQYLIDNNIADYYEEGKPKKGQSHAMLGSQPAELPYEHSIERFTGDETLNFLRNRDKQRPFFAHMSFQRPHDPITPSKEHFNMYSPDDIALPDSACDYFERRFAGKPQFMQQRVENGCGYPLGVQDVKELKRALASYYALITVIDMEIGRILSALKRSGELDNTIILYTADHGDFAGEHGLFYKNLGIYESIHRIPFLLSWPGGPRGIKSNAIVESIDWYTTACSLCGLEPPVQRDGIDLVSVASGKRPGKEAAFCEWDWHRPGGKIIAMRTSQYRIVFYEGCEEGELYDRQIDPGEINNLWNDPACLQIKADLLNRLFRFALQYETRSNIQSDNVHGRKNRYLPTPLLQTGQRYWSDLIKAYEQETAWPPDNGRS